MKWHYTCSNSLRCLIPCNQRIQYCSSVSFRNGSYRIESIWIRTVSCLTVNQIKLKRTRDIDEEMLEILTLLFNNLWFYWFHWLVCKDARKKKFIDWILVLWLSILLRQIETNRNKIKKNWIKTKQQTPLNDSLIEVINSNRTFLDSFVLFDFDF